MSGYLNFTEIKESILEDLYEELGNKNKCESVWNDIESYVKPLYEKVGERLPQDDYDVFHDVWEGEDYRLGEGLYVEITTTSTSTRQSEYTNFIQTNIKLDLASGKLVFTSRCCSNPSMCRTATRNTSHELIVDYDNCNDWTGFHEECVAMVGATIAEYIKNAN